MTADALRVLEPLVGAWSLEISDAAWLEVGDVQTGDLLVEQLEHGLLALRSVPTPPVPASLSLVGRNQHADGFTLLYADDRGVSRVYSMTFDGRTWTQERTDPDFHQRFRAELAADGAAVVGAWEVSHDEGVTWEHDVTIRYDRVG